MQHIHLFKKPYQIKQQYTRRIYSAVSLLCLTLLIGISGFMFIENYSIVEAVYMTVITLSTVGFTEVKPLSQQGQMFTSILILFNIGIFAYFVSTITSMIMGGELRRLFKYLKVRKQINQLQNHIIICGFGRLGQQVAEELNMEGIDFVAIESDPEIIELLNESKGFFIVEGDAMEEELLKSVNVSTAKALITTLPKDADNVFVVLSARQLNPALNIISRAANKSTSTKLKHAGANHVIMPEHLGGTHMAKLVTKPNLVEFLTEISSRSGVNVYFEECSLINLHSQYINKTIKELDVKERTGANIIGLRKGDGSFLINPSDDEIVKTDSKLIVLGDEDQIASFKEILTN